MKSLEARILSARKNAKLTQRELGLAVGVSAPAVTKWESGESKPSRDSIIGIARATGVSVPWLLFGHLPENHRADSVPVRLRELRSVPIVAFAEIFAGIDYAKAEQGPVNFPCGPRSFAYDLPDDSNADAFPKRTRLIIDPDRVPSPGDIVLAGYGAPLSAICGELSQETGASGRVTIITPRNSKWPACRSDIEHVEIIGVMSEAIIRAL